MLPVGHVSGREIRDTPVFKAPRTESPRLLWRWDAVLILRVEREAQEQPQVLGEQAAEERRAGEEDAHQLDGRQAHLCMVVLQKLQKLVVRALYELVGGAGGGKGGLAAQMRAAASRTSDRIRKGGELFRGTKREGHAGSTYATKTRASEAGDSCAAC